MCIVEHSCTWNVCVRISIYGPYITSIYCLYCENIPMCLHSFSQYIHTYNIS